MRRRALRPQSIPRLRPGRRSCRRGVAGSSAGNPSCGSLACLRRQTPEMLANTKPKGRLCSDSQSPVPPQVCVGHLLSSHSAYSMSGKKPAAVLKRSRTRNPGHLAPHRFQCKNGASMGHRLPHELLLELRTYLQHFDQTGHLGESETVAEIKNRLHKRIEEVEAQLRISGQHNPGYSPSDR